jgi:hypothetical protein
VGAGKATIRSSTPIILSETLQINNFEKKAIKIPKNNIKLKEQQFSSIFSARNF